MTSDDDSRNDTESAYQRFVDLGVETARTPGLYERLLREGIPALDHSPMDRSLREQNRKFNALLGSLSGEQRGEIADLLADSRASAIHSWFANLDCLVTDGYTISKDGHEIDTEIYWDMLHDFSARLNGELWPNESGDGTRMLRWVPMPDADENS